MPFPKGLIKPVYTTFWGKYLDLEFESYGSEKTAEALL